MIKLSFCFQLIHFLKSSLFSVHITNVTSTNFWKKKNKKKIKRSCVSKVGSRYSKYCFEKKKKKRKKKKTTTKNRQTKKNNNNKQKKTKNNKRKKKNAFGFEKTNKQKTKKKNNKKKQQQQQNKKNQKNKTKQNKKKTAELGFLGSISQTRRMNALLRGQEGGRGALRLFYGKHVLAILKTRSTRLELRNYSRRFTNL